MDIFSVENALAQRIAEAMIDGFNRRIGKRVNGVLTQGFLYECQLRFLPAVEPFQKGLNELLNVCQHVLVKFEASIKDYKAKN